MDKEFLKDELMKLEAEQKNAEANYHRIAGAVEFCNIRIAKIDDMKKSKNGKVRTKVNQET